MKPPIKVTPRTNNLNECSLVISDADGKSETIAVGASGNVYQGLHGVAPGLERIFNEALAAHGVTPAEDEPAPVTAQGEPDAAA
jgi:hypothetical protein